MTILAMNAFECEEEECHCVFAVDKNEHKEVHCPKCKSDNVCCVGDGDIDVSEH